MFLSIPRVLGALFSAVALCNALPQPESHAFQIGSGLHKRSALSEQYTSYAIAAINQMMTYYDATTGLFDGAWWNSANVITMLADYENAFPGVNKAFTHTIETTFAKAVSPFSPRGSFLNTFYDDELWWALAWIKVYDVTGNTTYLDKAAEIWKDPRSVWNATVCNNINGVHGGIWYVLFRPPKTENMTNLSGGTSPTHPSTPSRMSSSSPPPSSSQTASQATGSTSPSRFNNTNGSSPRA